MSANKLLTPDNHALLLIDHQYLQLLTLRSHDASQVIGNVQAVAKASRIFEVPTLLTTAFAERQDLIKDVQVVWCNA
jgi:nicotinamidase-related amidase